MNFLLIEVDIIGISLVCAYVYARINIECCPMRVLFCRGELAYITLLIESQYIAKSYLYICIVSPDFCQYTPLQESMN